MTTKTTNRTAEAVDRIARGRQIDPLSPTLYGCISGGLVEFNEHGEQILTAAGADVAAAFQRKAEAARAKRRAAARARSQAMSSLGLTRTRDGGWE